MRAKKKRDYLGLTLLISAFVLFIVFIVTCIKKRNLLAAIAAVAAANAIGGWWVLRCNRYDGCMFDFFDENHCEAFETSDSSRKRKSKRAEYDIYRDITTGGDAEIPIYEIPVDEETTEADFVK